MSIFTSIILHFLILYATEAIADDDFRCIDSERSSLLRIKAELIDDHRRLFTWEVEKDCCRWKGVRCDDSTNHTVALDLSNYLLRGNISPFLIELSELSYLDLSSNQFRKPIPSFIGSLGKLQYLNLSSSHFGGEIPHHLGNLSLLQVLDLGRNSYLSGSDITWVSGFHSLEFLDLSYVNLSQSTTWMQEISRISTLRTLTLKSCGLYNDTFPPLFELANSSTSLSFVDLSHNKLSSISSLLKMFNYIGRIRYIDFSNNSMRGKIPDVLGDMTHLFHADLSFNQLEGEIPNSLWNATMLEYLDLRQNQLSGSLPHVLVLQKLELLDLSGNRLAGSVPDLASCTSLRVVGLNNNSFNGTLTQSIGSLYQLEDLDLSSNNLQGLVNEAHFFNCSRLRTLDLSLNPNVAVKFSAEWNPPLRLQSINLTDCDLGPDFPKWLQTQKNITQVHISNTNISGTIPQWFWDNSHGMVSIKLSENRLYGAIPDLSNTPLAYVDLSYNNFSGSLPHFGAGLEYISLAGNEFSGTIFGICESHTSMVLLELSNNLLSGEITQCLQNLPNLIYFNVANNNLSGEIPKSFIWPSTLLSLHLRNNNFRGEILTSLRQCRMLYILDLGENNFTGRIPSWVGKGFPFLSALSLRSNNFNADLPATLCELQNLQFLDLSFNQITGTIPKCIYKLRSMGPNKANPPIRSRDRVRVTWKGREGYFENLRSLKAIDLSSNNIVGEIPVEITSLVGLFGLNLSHNNLTGSIPHDMDRLEVLNSLDLSSNSLSGNIPDTFSRFGFLGVLNLSFNKLSEKIPWFGKMQTFNSSSFAGNLQLCGPPLPKSCPENETLGKPDSAENSDDELINTAFYISMIIGFSMGFCGAFGILVLNEWRMINEINDFLYVSIAINWNRL